MFHNTFFAAEERKNIRSMGHNTYIYNALGILLYVLIMK